MLSRGYDMMCQLLEDSTTEGTSKLKQKTKANKPVDDVVV
jgi:hypothetical protein